MKKTPLREAMINLGLRKMAAAAGAMMPPPDLPVVEEQWNAPTDPNPTIENPNEQFTPEELAQLEAAAEASQAQQDAAPIAGEGDNTEAELGGIDGAVFQMLIDAYCAEVCAAWQYEWARISALGAGRNYLVSECTEHRDEEWGHATAIADLLDSLGGTIPFSLADIVKNNPTPGAPEESNNRDTAILTHQLVEAEQAAVDLYSQIIDATKDGGPVAEMVNNLAVDILTTEQKHVADMIKVSYAIGG